MNTSHTVEEKKEKIAPTTNKKSSSRGRQYRGGRGGRGRGRGRGRGGYKVSYVLKESVVVEKKDEQTQMQSQMQMPIEEEPPKQEKQEKQHEQHDNENTRKPKNRHEKRSKQNKSKRDFTKEQPYKRKTVGAKYGAFSKIQPKHSIQESESIEVDKESNIEKWVSGHTNRTEQMIRDLVEEKYECMICMNNIKKSVATWSCDNCYSLFHLYCTKKWFSESKVGPSSWICPACRQEVHKKPNKYLCFCKKMVDPVEAPYITPHSCGEICGRKRSHACPHTCNLLCHPGACPPCSALREISCHCGKNQTTIRCSEDKTHFSCGEVCGKVLNCGKHFCKEKCHEGDCQPCTEKYLQKCYCGKTQEERLCTATIIEGEEGDLRSFGCNSICGKRLECGNHFCDKKCHPGKCEECPFGVNVKTCPCGKTQLNIERKSCLDPIPTCHKTCNKLLLCKKHRCKKTCHNGPCGLCYESVKLSCRCKATYKNVPCALTYTNDESVEELRKKYNIKDMTFICNTPCNTSLNCTRHKCKVICCPDRGIRSYTKHICMRTCGKKLQCGKHKCAEPCHPGNCVPCSIIIQEPIYCRCGKTHLDPPKPCGTLPPVCEHPCSIVRECGHEPKHSCHFGNCPPCMTLVDKMCNGGHQIVKKIPCSTRDVSCGNVCGKLLGCGIHKCEKTCHLGECEPNKKEKRCHLKCMRELACGHLCQDQCHLDSPCDSEKCDQTVQIYCECKHRTNFIKCNELRNIFKEKFEGQTFHINSLPPMIECDSECRILARNKKLAEAFNIDLAKKEIPCYSKALQNFATKNLYFIEEIERTLAEFLQGEKQQYLFPPMPRDKRTAIHDLTDHYFIDSFSVDQEPKKSVVIAKTHKSRVPPVRLSVIIRDPSKLKILEEKLKEEEEKELAEQEKLTRPKKVKTKKVNEWDDENVDSIVVGNEMGDITRHLSANKPKQEHFLEDSNPWAVLEDNME